MKKKLNQVVSDLSNREEIDVPAKLLYEKIVENMNEGVWMGDENERTIYANPKFRKMVEYSLEEMIGMPSYDFWDEESQKIVKRENVEKRKHGKNSSYEGNLLTKSGKKIPVLLNGTPLPDGGTIGIMTDLTELREKERELRIMEKAIEHSSDAVLILDGKFKIRSWNKGAKLIFGYKKEEILGKKIWELFSKKKFEEVFNSEKVYQSFFISGIGKRKEVVDVAVSINTVEFEDGESYFLFIGRDITDERRYQIELSNKYVKIQEAYNQFGVIRRQMDYVFDLVNLSVQNEDKSLVVNYIVSSLVMISGAKVAVLRKYNRKTDNLELMGYFGEEDWEGKTGFEFKGSVAERAFKENKIIKVLDIYKEPVFATNRLARKLKLASMILCPIVSGGEMMGTISVYFDRNRNMTIYENPFLDSYLNLITIVMKQILA